MIQEYSRSCKTVLQTTVCNILPAAINQLDNILEGLIFDLLLQLHLFTYAQYYNGLIWKDAWRARVASSLKYTLAQSTISAVCSKTNTCTLSKKKKALKDSSAFTLKRVVHIFMVQQEQDHCSIFRSHSPPVQPYSVINTAVLHKNLLAFSY